MTAGMNMYIFGSAKNIEEAMIALDTALNPVAIAVFLGSAVDPYLRTRAKARFDSEGDDVVGQWEPLQESTQNIREQAGYGAAHPINKRTGELEEYIVGSPNALNIHPWGASLQLPGKPARGEMREKMQTAQSGRQWPQTVPRPVIGLNEKDLLFVMTSLARYIKTAGRAVS